MRRTPLRPSPTMLRRQRRNIPTKKHIRVPDKLFALPGRPVDRLNINVAVTTTAMRRPELLDKTYSSFSSNLVGIDFKQMTVFLNIDPLPTKVNPELVVAVAKKHFKHVVYNIASEPNFAKAVKWCWNNADTDYVFHLEDDWMLLRRIMVAEMVKGLENPNVYQYILRAFPEQYGIGLLPHLSKRDFYKTMARKMRDDVNPEVQMRLEERRILHTGQQWEPFEWLPGEPQIREENVVVTKQVVLRDLGRAWLAHRKDYKRPNPHFNKWELK